MQSLDPVFISEVMEGISLSTKQQTSSMEEATSTANKLGNIADELKGELEMFQIAVKDKTFRTPMEITEKPKSIKSKNIKC